MLLSKPYFTLHIASDNFIGFIYLNGQLLEIAEGIANNYEIPVGPFLKEESNDLLLVILPDDGDDYSAGLSVQLTLREREAGSPQDDFKPIATLIFSGARAQGGEGIEGNSGEHRVASARDYAVDDDGDVWIDEVSREDYGPGLIVRRDIFMPKMNLPRWKWLDSDDLSAAYPGPDIGARIDAAVYDQLKGELMPVYKQVWDALLAEDVSKIMPLFAERSEELEAAFFKQPGELQAQLGDTLAAAASDPDTKLWPISDDNVVVEVQDNNKLVRLKQNNDNPLIAFDFKDGGSQAFDISLRKSGDDWIITR